MRTRTTVGCPSPMGPGCRTPDLIPPFYTLHTVNAEDNGHVGSGDMGPPPSGVVRAGNPTLQGIGRVVRGGGVGGVPREGDIDPC